ncbi:MAG TPA: hypothetical protein VFE33_23710 [Thermoanaerobaculia bacterium]|nr:hypothetical protein [Thermoanaerobaculia bacterium]
MFQLPRRSLWAGLAAGLLALSGLACYRHHLPTEFVACPDLSGGWEEVADSSCLGTRRSSLSLKQTGCTVFASSAGLQADVTLALDERDRATARLNFFGCTGSVSGTATFNGHEVNGEFEGTTSGPQSSCCGHVKGTFRWLR